MDEKEEELVKIWEDAVKEVFTLVTKKFFISEECSIETPDYSLLILCE